MANQNDPFVSQMIQAISSLNLSPEQLQDALHSPESMIELMGRPSAQPTRDLGYAGSNENSFKQELDTAEARWREEARLPPQKPRATKRIDLEMINRDVSQEMSSEKFMFLKTFVGNKKSFSTIPISQLKFVSIRDMLARQVHKRQCLICRTIFKPVRRVAVELSIEDTNGDVVLLTLYNLPGLFLANHEVLEAHFPIGTVLAIREPWMKFPSAGSQQNSIIRVDSPSDILILEPSNPIIQDIRWKTTPTIYRHKFTTAEEWKGQGNKYFEGGLFVPAALAWSRGLELNPSLHALRLNRSQAYIKLEWFSAALADAVHVLEAGTSVVSNTTKASYRAASAEYGLERYGDALARLDTLDEDDAISVLKARCRGRIHETRTGDYEWITMFHAGQLTVPHLDVAQFVNPAVNVAVIPTRGGGRGIRSMRDIKTGDLLVVAKPLASVFPSELPKNVVVFGTNFSTRRSDKTTAIALITRVITRMHGCPEESDMIYHLYCGSTFPPPPPSYPPQISENAVPITPLSWKGDLDVAMIDGVVSYNAFSPNCVKTVSPDTLKSGDQSPEMETPSAIYGLPSLFNHSCHPNAVWRCFGDVMVIRARETIPRGSKITLAYTLGDTYVARDEKLKSILQAKCDCALCSSDRADGEEACRRREQLVEELLAVKRESNERKGTVMVEHTVIEAHVQSLASTYRSNCKLPRPALYRAHSDAMQSLELEASRKNRLDLLRLSIQQGFKALEAAGFIGIDSTLVGGKASRHALPLSKERLATCSVDIDTCALLMAHLSTSFVGLSQVIRAERWLRAAWWVHDASFGGGQALFNIRLGSFLNKMPVPSIQYRWN
ncbi:hypothetical protein PILCRDRAFT_431027 [Piloderma croceum F 1598]|uniref:SET domain-containing protein n=1 Tax=Piloderma croceum (strain F 1598) TaxID=765440 RepID=A0A0C3C288_PILCF|nr:hypothetical protein PILCRDRAFT_431027 [Piloderma croceum F 1598]